MILRRLLLILLFATGAGVSSALVPGVGWEQRLGETLPLTVPFQDTEGRTQPLGRWLHGKPVVLWFGYARCPQLCSVVADGMVSTLRQLQPSAGKEFEVVMISLDSTEPAAVAKRSRDEAVGHYGREPATRDWHYLVGNEPAIQQVADAAGFQFTYDARSQQYAHPAGFLVLTPQGRISAYFPGVEFAPTEVAAAIARAGRNGVGAKAVDFLLQCFRGDGISGRYGLVIWRSLSAAVAFTVLALATGIGRMLWLERKALRARGGENA